MKTLDDVQPASPEHTAQMSAVVAAAMSQEEIVVRPQERMRRNRDQ
jgi:hypothetical protein